MSWPIVTLNSLAEKIDYGLTASASEDQEGPRFLRITDLQNDSVNWKSVPFCACSEKDIEQYCLKKGDLVFARTGATTGKSYLLNDMPKDSVFASYLIRVRPNEKVDPQFLSFFFKSPKYWQQINVMANGAAQPGVNSTKLKELKIPLPPLTEQKRIAAILDKADSLRRKNQQAIQLADQFLRAVFLELFGKLFCDKGYPVAYKKPISELTTYIDYRGKTPEKSEYGVPLITAKNVKKGYVSEDPREYIPESNYEVWMTRGHPLENDVLFTTEAPLGNVGLLGKYEKVAVGQRLVSLRSKGELTQEYLLFCFLNPFIQNLIEQKSSGSTAKGIRTKELWQIELPIPDINEQNKFSIAYRKAIGINRKNSFANYSSDKLFNSLSQKAFAGEL